MDVDSTMDEARQLFEQPEAGGYPTTATLLKVLGEGVKNRLAFDIINPKLNLINDSVFIYTGTTVHELFKMNEPLISQLIYLKPFLCPENFHFFVQWLKQIHARSSDPLGRNILFAGSDKAEEWFTQQLPSIDMANPLQGALQTLQFAKMGI